MEHQVEEDVPHCVVEEEEKCEEETAGYSTKEKCMTWPVTRCKLVKRNVTKYTPSTKVRKNMFYLWLIYTSYIFSALGPR